MNFRRTELWTGRFFLVCLMAFTLLPFVSIFLMAIQPSGSLPQGLSWPSDPQWGNFVDAFEVANMRALLTSSFLIVLGVVPVAVVIATMAGFGIGLLEFPGARWVLLLFVFGLTLPIEGIIVPLYNLMRDYGLQNTRLAIVLPLIGIFMPFAVFWMNAHFANLPKEITEGARVDGAGEWALFRHIHVPLARAPIASLSILLSLWTWNQFLLALVLVEDPSKRTMAGALGAFQGQYATDIPVLCAGTLVILTPTLLTFLVLQRHLVSGLLEGAVKG
jgi:raffinose/stachyose/melibiose transport system permease protein